MSRQRIVFPRIRLTKTDKSHLILQVDTISAIEESRQDKCTKVYTVDGFWYDVVNPILEVDAKIDDALARANKQILSKREEADEDQDSAPTRISNRKRKRMLAAAGIDKPERRLADNSDNAPEASPESVGEESDALQRGVSEEASDAQA